MTSYTKTELNRIARQKDRLIASNTELLRCLIVACDWLADKGVPSEHIEMRRIHAAIANAEKK